VKLLCISIIALFAAPAVMAERVTLFGSAGFERQHAPANDDSPLNPDNFLSIRENSSSADFAFFVTVTPEDERWKIRTKMRGDANDGGSGNVEIAEASLQLQLNDAIDVTAGRVIERWGTGYGWTPTAFVGPERNPTDPGDRRSLSSGLDMVRLTGFARETRVSLYLLDGGTAAIRAYRLVAGTDVSVSLFRDGPERRQGVSLSRVFGEALELHVEAAHGKTDNTGQIVQIVAGGQYTWRKVNIVAEWHHRGDGMSHHQWNSFRGEVDEALRTGDRISLITANREFAPLRMERNYAFLRVAGTLSGIKTDAEMITVTNLRDRSSLIRASLTRRLHENLSLVVMNTEFIGGSGSEISYIQVERVTAAGVRLHF
jgi:hypothetical protein